METVIEKIVRQKSKEMAFRLAASIRKIMAEDAKKAKFLNGN